MAEEFHLLLACTGSVATIKLSKLVQQLKEKFLKIKITVVLTDNANFFVTDEDRNKVEEFCDKVYTDENEWTMWKKKGDDVLHIELAKWAHCFLIAPLDANTLAKISNGICDNLLTCVCRAWNFSKPIICAPAMNTNMWNHPTTMTHIDLLKTWSFQVIYPISKKLACGDTGIGAMAEVEDIVTYMDSVIMK